jgi:hypothetical protein
MSFGVVIALVGLTFSIISIRLMSIVENAQVVIVGAIGKHHRRLLKQNDKVVAVGIGARKFLAIKIGIAFFGKVSSIIFASQDMYSEKIVEGATLAMMNTVLLSNKLGKVAAKHSRDTAEKIMTKYYDKRKK